MDEPVEAAPGIIRHVQNEEQMEMFLSHVEKYCDVKRLQGHAFMIKSGRTLYCTRYLQGLWKAIESKGGVLVQKEVNNLNLDVDCVVLTAGAGICSFLEANALPIKLIKGQVLTCEWPSSQLPLEHSLIGKGYMVPAEDPRYCYLGSTYEKQDLTETPDLDIAIREILPRIASFYPEADKLKVVGCKAGVRVMRAGHYLPLICKLKPNLYAVTGMGSRGLLYHAFYGKLLKELLFDEKAFKQQPIAVHCYHS
jgi:glycine/D-amino acid oxidase-like deaminating enzyme